MYTLSDGLVWLPGASPAAGTLVLALKAATDAAEGNGYAFSDEREPDQKARDDRRYRDRDDRGSVRERHPDRDTGVQSQYRGRHDGAGRVGAAPLEHPRK